MADDEQQKPAEESTPEESTPEESTPEEGTPEEQQAEEQAAPEEHPPSEGGTPERGESEPEPPPAEEALAEDAAAEDDTPAAEEAATPPEEAATPPEGKKKEEVVPGAELDPIALEPDRPLDAEERARREAEEEERAKRERELIGEEGEDAPLATKPTKISGDASYSATGKRKSSIARVILRAGDGNIQVNKRSLEEYFPRAYLQTVAKQALVQSGYEGNVDVRVRVHGGGISGQASAVRHGIARALCDVDPALRPELKRRGMLTRDSRVKERRKAGLKKARKKPQFSKR
ncbi:MAG: small subunit ribosomal protein [Solirubrobacterales bacterium]|nr:small subunit ribosomal protein [Solirubrobacterales bacterium]